MTGQHVVIVTGGRDYPIGLRRVVALNLNAMYVQYGNFILFHGACTPRGSLEMVGADRYADDWAHTAPGIDLRQRPADWGSYGDRAGPLRNAQMVHEAVQLAPVHQIHGLAFPTPASRGTWNCVKEMRRIGVEPDIWNVHRAEQWLAGQLAA